MSKFNHRLITFEELDNPDLIGMLNNEKISRYRNIEYSNNGYFKLKEVLSLLRTVLGEDNTEKLLESDSELTIRLFTELCIDMIDDIGIPAKDLQMSFFYNYFKNNIKGGGNNLKTYRRLVRESIENYDLEETFANKLQELLMDNVKLPSHLYIIRF